MEEQKLAPDVGALLGAHGLTPGASEWNPVEEALYAADPFARSDEEASALLFNAVRASFDYQFEHNAFYRRYCETAGFFPADLAGPRDMHRIPLVPERIFKSSPGAEDFLAWIASISSDEITWPGSDLRGSYDEQIAILREQFGVLVRTTSGSSGVPSFLPREETTRRRSAHWKILSYHAMYPDVLSSDLISVTLWPLEFSWADLVAPPERVHALLDKKLGLETVIRAMTAGSTGGTFARLIGRSPRRGGELLGSLARRLSELAEGARGVLWIPPFLLYALARFAVDAKIKIPMDSRWTIELAGGWKLVGEAPVSDTELYALASEAFGVVPEKIHDLYGLTECLGLVGLSCEGGFKHVPPATLYPLVLDEKMASAPEGAWGRFAFLNPLIRAYPGFIVTGDRVRLRRSCPACPRKGPVLDAFVSRLPEAEERGCANIVRQLIAERLG